MELVADVEEGEVYEGTVIEIKDFGAIIELLRNKEGLLHVSELSNEIESHPKGNLGIVGEHLKVGQKIEVLCTGVDPVQGSIRLSAKGFCGGIGSCNLTSNCCSAFVLTDRRGETILIDLLKQ